MDRVIKIYKINLLVVIYKTGNYFFKVYIKKIVIKWQTYLFVIKL